MAELGEIAQKVRSKECRAAVLADHRHLAAAPRCWIGSARLKDDEVARLLRVDRQLKRFDIADLNVVKISFPRPQVQGQGRTATCTAPAGDAFWKRCRSTDSSAAPHTVLLPPCARVGAAGRVRPPKVLGIPFRLRPCGPGAEGVSNH